jgi:hypothetical protein
MKWPTKRTEKFKFNPCNATYNRPIKIKLIGTFFKLSVANIPEEETHVPSRRLGLKKIVTPLMKNDSKRHSMT